jgi:hypothetical protein
MVKFSNDFVAHHIDFIVEYLTNWHIKNINDYTPNSSHDILGNLIISQQKLINTIADSDKKIFDRLIDIAAIFKRFI